MDPGSHGDRDDGMWGGFCFFPSSHVGFAERGATRGASLGGLPAQSVEARVRGNASQTGDSLYTNDALDSHHRKQSPLWWDRIKPIGAIQSGI
jgi:hypothetical protein